MFDSVELFLTYLYIITPKDLCHLHLLHPKLINTRKYPLRGCFLGPPGWPEGLFFREGQTDADGASGAINGMKR